MFPARDLAQHDGGADGLLGTPVRRVDSVVEQEREHAGEFARHMAGEALNVRDGTGGLHQRIQAVEQMAARDGDAVGRDGESARSRRRFRAADWHSSAAWVARRAVPSLETSCSLDGNVEQWVCSSNLLSSLPPPLPGLPRLPPARLRILYSPDLCPLEDFQ